MDIRVNQEGAVKVVEMSGNFDIANAEVFDKEISGLMDSGAKIILLDFSDVSYIASTGLRMLLKSAQRSKDESGNFGLCCVNDSVKEVFTMTGFDTILNLFETKEQALEEFA